ncbi:CD109 antigen-like [Anopheles darlingi]|uniref:CD109 antigen-like n=1 Tax=Anopheles darlingi TaxID=43151 RepID=UPI00210011BC|nr:CD109 antigen-like [Anopheles darlingi]
MCWLSSVTICATLVLTSMAHDLIVVGPNSIRSNRSYTVTIFNLCTKKVDFMLHLECFGKDDIITFNNTMSGSVKSTDVKSMSLKIPDIRSTNSGRITISGKIKKKTFSKTVDLGYQTKSISSFIHLSKPVYKPGDSVQFRVIVLDLDLKPPSGLKMITVTVQDTIGNNIRFWTDAKVNNGVFEGQLDIASSPLLGIYNIKVEANGEELVSKTFEVKEYVLSTFEINVRPTVVPLLEHQALILTIAANYYFGKPVIGSVKIDLYDDENKSLYKLKQADLNGMLQVHLPFTEPLSIVELQQDVNVKVTFTERYTNRTIIKDYQITVYKHKYRVVLGKVLQPNSYPQYTLKIEHQNGTPAEGVNLQVRGGGITSNGWTQNVTSSKGGNISLSLPPFNMTQIISVSHAGKQIFKTEIEKGEIQSYTFDINVEVKSIIGKIKLQIKSSHRLQFFIYYIVSKGNIVDAKYVSANSIEKITHYINVSQNMLPRAKLICMTVIDGSMLTVTKQINFEEFSNKFDLTTEDDDGDLKPGRQIVLKITGPPKAYVALASYDQSLLQHGTGHDIVREDVWNLVDENISDDPHSYNCFHSMVLFTLPGSHNTDCEVNDKASRQDHLSNIFKNYELQWRTTFSENWLWESYHIPHSGRKKLIKYVPDTITSWYLSGFSIDPMYGFGMIKKPIQFTTVQPFYIVDHLPYSIKRGEVVLLQFTLFSALNNIYISDVTLYNIDNQMEFIGYSGNGNNYTKAFSVPPNVGFPVSFQVKAKTLGEMIVRVKAKIMMGLEHDAIEKIIRVLPESLEQTHVRTELFTSNDRVRKSFEVPLDVPEKAEPGSVRIEFSFAPNIFTFVIPNLEQLLSVPTGCGEQNMIRFVPNVVVLDYLYATKSNDSSATDQRVKQLLRTGYQNQLKYRKADGSFAVFTTSKGSIFLTAFVGKSFHIASKYISVDENVVSKAFNWLATKQQPDGRFNEVGYIFSWDMQGGLRAGISLTSYVMIAFLESKLYTVNHTAVIEKGMAYIAKNIDNITDPYDLSIATYALWLNNHSNKSIALDKLKGNSTTNEKNQRYWSRKTSQIETTAYALLTLIEAKDYTESLATARWLLNQTYETGSFPRTQDTFVGLKALAKFIERFNLAESDYEVRLQATGVNQSFVIHSSQNVTYSNIPDTIRKMKIDVTGKGTGLFRVTYKYLLNLLNFNYRFNITVKKEVLTSESALKLIICSNFIPEYSGERSNMALMEVTFPSGYVADIDSIKELTSTDPIEKIEPLHGGTMVVMYYMNMGDVPNCFVITAHMRFKVAFRRPAYVKVQDYYTPEYNALHVYNIDETGI